MSEHTIVGTVRVLGQVASPELGNQRDILVYLPPGYDTSQQRYPVIYMHDGQNLFDEATSYNRPAVSDAAGSPAHRDYGVVDGRLD